MAISSPALFLSPRFSPAFSLSTSSSSLISPSNACSRLVLTQTRPGNVRSRRRFSCTCLFGLGVPEIAVIAGVAALVFGPKQLPDIGKRIGKTVKSFQQAALEFESELKKEPEPLDDSVGLKPTSVAHEQEQEKF